MIENYKDFVITSEQVAEGFVARIRRRDNKPFVVARAEKQEFSTPEYADESDAMREARSLANSASLP
ncbi:MAG TPA: hypothetical protein VGK90_06115 [Rhizomicrobium sp.]|jgi:hypothetical protein